MVFRAGELPPRGALLRMATASWVPHAVRAMATIGLADHLAAGPRSAVELADATRTHAPPSPVSCGLWPRSAPSPAIRTAGRG